MNQDHVGLDERDVDPDPMAQFESWYSDALRADLPRADAVALATVGTDGSPSVRMVLLKGTDASGFVFFTNYESRKGRELLANPRAGLAFYWARSPVARYNWELSGFTARLGRLERRVTFTRRASAQGGLTADGAAEG